MKEENKYTVLVIGDTPFAIDTAERQFRQWNTTANVIPYDALKDEGRFFSLQYDRTSRNVAGATTGSVMQSENIINVIIPALLLDETITSPSVQKAINENAMDLNWRIFLGDEDVALRLSGKLPHIDLAGNDFTIDWRLRELRETAEPWKHISFDKMGLSLSGDTYLCFFNTKDRTAYTPDANHMTFLPEHVVLLEIPNELKLDPVAVARSNGLRDTALLLSHPIQTELKAGIKPLSESALPGIVKQNLKRQEQKKNKALKRKRGRGL